MATDDRLAKESRQAERIAFETISKTQRSGVLPEWFIKNVATIREQTRDHVWRVMFHMFKRRKLAPNEWWEEVNGKNVLARIDPISGEKQYAILYGSYEENRVDLFEVEVDLARHSALIKNATDLADLDAEELDIHYPG